MKLRSDFRTAVTIMNRLHRESGDDRAEPILFHHYQRWHSSSSSSTLWWQWNENWWSSHVLVFCTPIVYSLWQYAATDGVSEQNTLTRHNFSCLSALMIMSHTTLAQGVSARHTISVSCACVFDLSSTFSSHSSFVSPIFYFIFLMFHFFFYVDRFGAKPLCASANEESGPLVNNAPLTKDGSSIAHDQTRSSFTEHYLRCASTRWWPRSQEKKFSCTEAELALWPPGHYKLRRENVNSTKQSKNRLSSSRCIQTTKHYMPTWSKIAHPIHSVSSRRKCSHGKHGVVRDLRDHSQQTMHKLFEILAERYCINYMRNMLTTCRQSWKLNSDRCDVLSLPKSHQKVPVPWCTPREHGETESTLQPTSHLKKAKKKEYNLRYQQSQMNIGWTEDHCARLDEIDTAAERARRENGPMNRREDYQEAIRIKERLFQESCHDNLGLHLREEVVQRPEQPFAWHDDGSERGDPKAGWWWDDTKPSKSSSSSEWQRSSWWQSSSWSSTSRWGKRLFFRKCQGVSLTGNVDSFASDGGCQHYTKLAHTSHSRTGDSSRVAQDLSHRVRIFTICAEKFTNRPCFRICWP